MMLETLLLLFGTFLILGAVVEMSVTFRAGGEEFRATQSREVDHPNPYGPITLPAGKTVTAWVKTDADTADATLPNGHGYTDGNFDVYWDGGRRYGVPGTIVGDDITLDGGAGDDFPASATEDVVVTKQVTINTAIDGDAISMIGICMQTSNRSLSIPGHLQMQDSGAADIENLDLTSNAPQVWDIAGGHTNVFTGNPIVASYASCGSADYDAELYILSGEDATP